MLCVHDEPLVLEGLHDVLARSLTRQAAHAGLLERYTMIERAGAIIVRDLQGRGVDGFELLGARRLLLRLRQLVLEAEDARG